MIHKGCGLRRTDFFREGFQAGPCALQIFNLILLLFQNLFKLFNLARLTSVRDINAPSRTFRVPESGVHEKPPAALGFTARHYFPRKAFAC